MDPNSNQPRKFDRGLYRGVNISVKTLNMVIVAGVILIVLLLVYGISTGGYTITFNSKGGSDVPYQKAKYGDTIQWPQNPTREGYEFKGWSLNESCTQMAEKEVTIESNMELFACWN